MISSAELAAYTTAQLNTFFPDRRPVDERELCHFVDLAAQRYEYCFTRVAIGPPGLDVLHSDRYCAYLYFLSNTIFREGGDARIAEKVFYLNKALHAFNCMYDCGLPDVFVLIHVIGTVLGKATYSNYLVVGQNCTVGAIRGEYPVLGERVIMGAGTSIIGKCQVGDDVMLAPGTQVLMRDVPSNTLVRTSTDIEMRSYAGNAALTYFKTP